MKRNRNYHKRVKFFKSVTLLIQKSTLDLDDIIDGSRYYLKYHTGLAVPNQSN